MCFWNKRGILSTCPEVLMPIWSFDELPLTKFLLMTVSDTFHVMINLSVWKTRQQIQERGVPSIGHTSSISASKLMAFIRPS